MKDNPKQSSPNSWEALPPNDAPRGTPPPEPPNDSGGVWNQFLGHPRVASVLKGAAAHPTGPYLFVGAQGTGKRNAARVLAAALLCGESCGACNDCRRVMAGLHPDVTILQPEGYTFPVEVLRATAHAASQTPIEADHRIFIVQEADRIPERSQNALLKALEEPNRTVIWILVASAVQPFLPTILSRCQVVDFPPIGEDSMVALVSKQLSISGEEAERLVRISRGDLHSAIQLAENSDAAELRATAISLAASPSMSIGQALQGADAVRALAAKAREKLEQEQAAEMARLEEVSGKEGQAALRKRLGDRNKRALRREETEVLVQFLSWMGSAFRDLAATSAGAPEESLLAYDHAELLGRAAPRRPTRFWVDMIDHCLQAQMALRSNANPALAVESLLLRFV